MENALSVVSLVAGLGAGTLAFVAAGKNPEKAKQLRGLGAMFFGIAVLMGLSLLL